MQEKELPGGRKGKIYRVEGNVIRPAFKGTPHIHAFLRFLIREGADFVPKPQGINPQGKEVISFMPGDVFNYPLPPALRRDSMLISAAKLLLSFHTLGKGYLPRLSDSQEWMLPPFPPIEVMCHGDFAPYNVTIRDNEAAGIIDFDTLHPGSKMEDIAYAIYRWVPFTHPENPDCYDDLGEQIRKAALFLDAYGIKNQDRDSVVDVLIQRLQNLVNFMRFEAGRGSQDIQTHIEAGHLQLYLDDKAYWEKHKQRITAGLKRISP